MTLCSQDSDKPVAAEAEAVVLVHGIWCKSPVMWFIAWQLRQQGYKTYCLSYASVLGSFDRNVDRMLQKLERVREPVVHFVAHSFGGLLLTCLLDKGGKRFEGSFVLLGSPVRGAQLAAGVMQGRFRRHLLGKATCSPLVTGIDKGKLERVSANRKVGVVSGTHNLTLLGRIFGRLERGDGLVAEGETHFPGARPLELPVTHAGFLFSVDTCTQIIRFLRYGDFRD